MVESSVPETGSHSLSDLPHLPYDALTQYAIRLRDPHIFQPQTKSGIIHIGNGGVYETVDGLYPDVNPNMLLAQHVRVDFPKTITIQAFDAMAHSLKEHFQHAVGIIDIGIDEIEFDVKTYSVNEFISEFPNSRHPVMGISKEKIKAILLLRKFKYQTSKECVLYMQPISTSHDILDTHLAISHMDVVIEAKDNPRPVVDIFASFVLSGFPWSIRN